MWRVNIWLKYLRKKAVNSIANPRFFGDTGSGKLQNLLFLSMNASTPLLHVGILPPNQQAILPSLTPLKKEWYLAGGTALALLIGHRESVDFDFFCPDVFDSSELSRELASFLPSFEITQEEENTLGLLMNGVKISFMTFQYPLLKPLIETPELMLASLEDIAGMKLSAIRSRHAQKDYIDLYFLLQIFSVSEICGFFFEKFGHVITESLLRKYLTYFDDIELADIRMHTDVSWEDMKKWLIEKAIQFEG